MRLLKIQIYHVLLKVGYQIQKGTKSSFFASPEDYKKTPRNKTKQIGTKKALHSLKKSYLRHLMSFDIIWSLK